MTIYQFFLVLVCIFLTIILQCLPICHAFPAGAPAPAPPPTTTTTTASTTQATVATTVASAAAATTVATAGTATTVANAGTATTVANAGTATTVANAGTATTVATAGTATTVANAGTATTVANSAATVPAAPSANSTADTKIKVKFVSLRCGIGGRWNQAAQVCAPYTGDSDEESSEEESTTVAPKLDKRLAVDDVISEEIVKWQIITVMCGIGYRYLRKEKICRPLEWDGNETPEHRKIAP